MIILCSKDENNIMRGILNKFNSVGLYYLIIKISNNKKLDDYCIYLIINLNRIKSFFFNILNIIIINLYIWIGCSTKNFKDPYVKIF